MTNFGPNPNMVHPMPHHPKIVFLKNIITRPNIQVGDYTYYHDLDDPFNFENNVLYHHDFIGDKLIIGKFCAIASGVKFIMNGANHEIKPVSTFPFFIFGNGWESVFDGVDMSNKFPYKGDTIIANDVWIGNGATIMPGVKIGNGAIIATGSIVAKNVPDYAVVGGNPAQIIRKRFSAADIERLLAVAWWNWSAEQITGNLKLINNADIDALEQAGLSLK